MRRCEHQKIAAGFLFRYRFRKKSPSIYQMTCLFTIRSGTCVEGESGRKYRLLSPLSKSPSNVWKAIDAQDEYLEYVVKAPNNHDDVSLDWPLFRHEIQMQRRFNKSPLIRQMIDFVPHSNSTPPIAVLQAFEMSLWNARNRRHFALDEIKWIMKAVLIALWTIHREGLVYSGA